MTWTPVPFGKYKGKIVPRIVLTDPDWFFWVAETDAFKTSSLRTEAAEIHRKAKTIKFPDQTLTAKEIEYFIQPGTEKLAIVGVVSASKLPHVGSSRTHRTSYFDLSMPRQIAKYDKFGGENHFQSNQEIRLGE